MQTGLDDGPPLPAHVIRAWKRRRAEEMRGNGSSLRAIAKEIGMSHEGVRSLIGEARRKYVETQPGSPNFDGADAWNFYHDVKEDVRTPVPSDWDRWEPNITAWGNWDGTVTLSSECPIGRASCVPNSRPPHDECPYFMGIKTDGGKGCCGYILNRSPAAAFDRGETE